MTSKQIENATEGVLWDDIIKGLHVRIFGKRKAFYLKYRTAHGVQRRKKLGDYGILTLAAARDIAREKLSILLSGGDPDAPAPERHTVRDLFNHYLSVHYPTQARATQRNYRRAWEKDILPRLGGKDVNEVTESDCVSLFHSMSKTPSRANFTMAVLRAGMNLAEEWGWKKRHTNPVHVKFHYEEARERFPDQEEAKRLLKAIEETRKKHPVFASYLMLLALTGCRPGEILTAKREWITDQGLRLPESKRKKKGRLVTLSRMAREVIAETPIFHGNPYLIPGSKEGHHLVGTGKLWTKLLEEAGIEDLQMRDLRRYFASLVLSDGFTLEQVGQLLGHTQPRTTKRYAYLMQGARETAASSVENALKKISGSSRKASSSPRPGRARRPGRPSDSKAFH